AGIGTVRGGIEIADGPWDGITTTFKSPPATRHVTVNLPGIKKVGYGGSTGRSVRLTGGPLETFGDGSLTIRYTGQHGWGRLTASVAIKGSSTPLTFGGVRVKKSAGVLRIPLSDQAVLIPRGKRLAVSVGDQSAGNVYASLCCGPTPKPAPTITIGRITLNLSLLK